MARLNTAQLISLATTAGPICHRAYIVQQDSAVRQSCRVARQDTATAFEATKTALKSVTAALNVTWSAWGRSAPLGRPTIVQIHA
jgi:hypothetical protein